MSIFSSVPVQKVKRAKFDLKHVYKFTGNMGKLIPCLAMDVLPGETIRNISTLMLRVAPLVAPVMHRFYASMHFFFVPNRLLSSDWEDFITSGEDGESAAEAPYFAAPTIFRAANANEPFFQSYFGTGSLWNYFGLPRIPFSATDGDYVDTTRINALPFFAYQKIWEEYYRDQNLDNTDIIGIPIPGGDQSNIFQDFTVKDRAWRKDAYTSALPWPQRGPEVLVPMTAEADATDITYANVSTVFRDADDTQDGLELGVGGNLEAPALVNGPARIENIAGVTVENANITINDLRTAIVLQQWYENNARGGNRYKESLMVHFNANVKDSRLQRPEYLGGGQQDIQISEVLSTAAATQDSVDIPQGNMAGHGISVGSSNRFKYTVTEHGWIIGIVSILPEPGYTQGIDRKFLKLDRFDYAWPEFVGLGEQEIISKEVYYDPTDTAQDNDELFGYQQRYFEYKYAPSRSVGEFQTTLAHWTADRFFETRPALDTSFIYADPTDRIFAVQDDSHKIWAQVFHNTQAIRPLPYYSVPGLLKV